jgi:arsenical pump membrane protein
LVNLVNDLPASALLGGLLAGAPPVSGPGGTVMVQSVVVSLNLGCYLTPVGALAGLMWFHILRRDGARYGLLVPRPLDLLWYGSLHFLVCGGLMWALLPLGPAVR